MPGKYFNKKNFQFPRDLAGWTLVKVGKVAILYLIGVLEMEEKVYDDFVNSKNRSLLPLIFKINFNNFIIKKIHMIII